MSNNDVTTSEFLSTLSLHSELQTSPHKVDALIYQLRQKPYNFYVSLQLVGDERLLSFYQLISSFGQPIASIRHAQVLRAECSLWQTLRIKPKTESGKVRLFMNYQNFSLKDWIILRQKCQGLVSQQQIAYILNHLLTVAIKFKRTFKISAEVFQSQTILLSTTRKIVLYPSSFPFNQNLINQKQIIAQNSQLQSLKHQSHEKASFNSTLQSSRVNQDIPQRCEDADLTSIILIVLQLLAFKPKAYFYNANHKMLKKDLVRQYLQDKRYTGHLQPHFLSVIRSASEGQVNFCQVLRENLKNYFEKQKLIDCLGAPFQSQLKQKKLNLVKESSQQREKLAQRVVCLGRISTIKTHKCFDR